MSKKRRKQRVVGRAPQSRQAVPTSISEPQVEQSVHVPEELEETGVLWEAEYVFQQYYEITIDESEVKMPQEDLPRLKRMLKSLVKDKKALHAVCEFLVYRELEDGDSYCQEHYGDYNKSLADILEEHADCFVLEDRELYMFDALREAIQLEPSGFNVGRHACQIDENEGTISHSQSR